MRLPRHLRPTEPLLQRQNAVRVDLALGNEPGSCPGDVCWTSRRRLLAKRTLRDMPGRPTPDRDRVLATVLFTDIVGSTERAAQLGDAGWRDLMARHHSAVRREVRRFGGREQDSAGDGFFLAFDRPLAALRCAAAILAAVGSIGLEERAAAHSGEVERMQGKLGGIAVHTAARMLAIAAPGEVLVSATTRELVAGAGLRFDDRGSHALRGLPDPIHLYSLAEPEALVAQSAQRVVANGPPLRRFATAAGAIAVLAVLALAIAAFASRGIGAGGAGSSSPSGGTPIIGGSDIASGSSSPGAAATTGSGAGLPANLPPTGAIAPGTYLLAALRGGVSVTIADPYWANSYNVYWYPRSYPDTRVRLIQVPVPSGAGCGRPGAPASAPSGSLYDDWVSWLIHDPALATSSPTRRLFGTTGATQLDTRVIAARACASDPNFIDVGRFVRVYVIDSPDPFLVVLDAPTQQQLEAAGSEVDAMLTTVQFEP